MIGLGMFCKSFLVILSIDILFVNYDYNLLFCVCNMESMEEIKLIEQMKSGDNQAFAALYDLYCPKVYNFTRLYISSSDEVAEVVQDVFVKLWESRHLIIEEKGLEGFLFIITRNLIFNMNRRNFRETMLKMTVLKAVEEEGSSNIEEEFAATDLKRYIDGLVTQLPERQQRVFRMSREEHMSYREIAERLNITEKAVERHIYLALKFLRSNLPFFILFVS